MQKITPFLWFDTQAEEAMNFYTGIFENARIMSIQRYPEGPLTGPMQGMEGRVITGVFELAGQRFMALDGGPTFRFTPAISFFVNCDTVAEIDRLWAELSAGGSALMPFQQYPFSEKFGWVADKYGVTWQLNLGSRAQKITPFLLFVGEQHGKAVDAIQLYTSLFQDAGTTHLERFQAGENGDVGAAKPTVFRLAGQEFMSLDSDYNHQFGFTEAMSFYVDCDSQAEVDHFWDTLSADTGAEQCGWLKDQFGVSWQIVPRALGELMSDPDPERSKRVMDAMLQMKKIDIAGLQRAYDG